MSQPLRHGKRSVDPEAVDEATGRHEEAADPGVEPGELLWVGSFDEGKLFGLSQRVALEEAGMTCEKRSMGAVSSGRQPGLAIHLVPVSTLSRRSPSAMRIDCPRNGAPVDRSDGPSAAPSC